MPETATPSEGTFETALVELETIVRELEEGKLGLAECLGRYESGVKLLKQCYGLLERAERRIELLCGVDADGNPIVRPLDHEASLAADGAAPARSGRRRKAPVDVAAESVDGELFPRD